MIKTTKNSEITPWEQDALVVAALGAINLGSNKNGNLMRHAILNSGGERYRIVRTWGLTAFLNTVNALSGCGLTDLLRQHTSMRDGYDAIWAPTGVQIDV